jgi:hypothetical protein
MPMVVYLCANGTCHDRESERFFHPTQAPPETAACEACAGTTHRSDAVEHTIKRPPSRAMRFDPVVVDRRKAADGSWIYSYPGHSSDPVDAGYERVMLDNLSQVDRFVKDRNAEESELRKMQIHAERAHWDERTKERRDNTRQQLTKMGIGESRVFDLVNRFVDAKREKRYRQLLSRDTGFHHQAFSYDASNRQEYRDRDNVRQGK